MPTSPLLACPCGGRRASGQPCPRCGKGGKREARRNSTYHSDNKLYGRQWKKASRRHRSQNPLCEECLKEGIATAAWATDHVIPHKGDLGLFWDETNWRSLCERHHNEKSARERT